MSGVQLLAILISVWAAPIHSEQTKCPFEGPEDPEVDILLPHDTDCTKFYKCSHGVAVQMQCPSDLYFNPDLNYCDYQYNVKCDKNHYLDNINNSLLENAMKSKDDGCPLENPEVDVLYPHETNCSKFYKCNNGKKVPQDCPAGLYFNPKQDYCDWPENVNCSNQNGPIKKDELLINYIAENGRFCPLENPEEDILYSHESNCSLFYKCFNGKLVAHACPPNLYYNPDRKYCDWPENVKCKNNNHEDNVVNNTGDCPLENPEQDILYPHESKCNVFYKCSNGKKVAIECHPGLYFNPKKSACDWPENVACSN